VHWALRREELCEQRLCPDSPEDGGRCDHCPITQLEAAESSERGIVIRCALDLMNAMKLGVNVSLEEITANEFQAMLIIAQERDLLEREKLPGHGR
jgi:hypothetical protein